MTKRSFRPAAAFFVFAAFILMIACGGAQNTAPNKNAATNSNTAANSTANANTTANVDSNSTQKSNPGGGGTLAATCTRTEIETGVKDGFKGNSSLNGQYAKHTFDFTVQESEDGDYFDIYVQGKLGTGLGSQDQMFHFQKSIRKFIKKGCVQSVYFVPDGYLKSGERLAPQGFRWYTCDDGKDPCDNGSCSRPCPFVPPGKEGEISAVSNSTSGANNNSNK